MAHLLASKIALITGGTTGIGLATARRFIDEGATVILTGQDPERVDAARAELGGAAEVVRCDATAQEEVEALFSDLRAEHGRLDILFANAGVARFMPLEYAPVEHFDLMFSVNVRGVFLALKGALPLLAPGGSVVFNTSAVAHKGIPGSAIYAATKAALAGLMRVAAAELAPKGVRVNAVCPGPIETAIYQKLGVPPEVASQISTSIGAQVPMGRFGRPEEIADAVLYLCSDQASYVSGAELMVGGGFGSC